jgi:DNA-binding NarL/FixJ family response regulator
LDEAARWKQNNFVSAVALTAKINLLLLEDQALFRDTLSRIIETEPGLNIIAHCSSTTAALKALNQLPVDLILLDYDFGDRQTGFDFIRRVRGDDQQVRIFLVTGGMEDADYLHALELGIGGIFLKQSGADLLVAAIHKVVAGETWLDQRCLQGLVKAVGAEHRLKRRGRLTAREHGVLKCVYTGLSNKETAAELSISEASVKSALQQLFRKTGVRTRTQLVRVALRDYGVDREIGS